MGSWSRRGVEFQGWPSAPTAPNRARVIGRDWTEETDGCTGGNEAPVGLSLRRQNVNKIVVGLPCDSTHYILRDCLFTSLIESQWVTSGISPWGRGQAFWWHLLLKLRWDQCLTWFTNQQRSSKAKVPVFAILPHWHFVFWASPVQLRNTHLKLDSGTRELPSLKKASPVILSKEGLDKNLRIFEMRCDFIIFSLLTDTGSETVEI